MKRIAPILLFSVPLLALAASTQKVIVGRVERITIPQYGITLEARVDTGAHTSSLHVSNQKVTRVGTEKYIEFDTEDADGKTYHIKTKVHKESRVKDGSGGAEFRYVIRQEVQLGNVTKKVNINLSDREQLKYNFLLGRNFLRGDFLVDVSLSHLLGD